MKKRIKSLFVAVLVLAMFATGMMETDTRVKAAPGDLKIVEGSEFTVKPGETSHIKISLEATEFMAKPEITMNAGTNAPFTFTAPSMHVGLTDVTSLINGNITTLDFDVKVKDTATIGTYPVVINFSYFDIYGGSGACSVTFNLKINEEKTPARLTVGYVILGNSSLGSKTNMSFTVKNEGEVIAKNVYLNMTFGDSIEERYAVKDVKIGDMDPGETRDMTLPISILPTATVGRKTISANFTYKTVEGDSLPASKFDFYINLTAASTGTQTPKLNVEDVQYGEGLKPGNTFTMSVDLKNIGGSEAKDVTVTIDGASVDPSGIIKNYFTDGISVYSIKKDTQKTAEIPLSVSKYATGGLKPVKILISYTDEIGAAYSLNETVYVDVVAATSDAGSSNLIISNVSQNPAKPVAGEKVEISFDLENKSKVDVTELKIAATGLSEATFIPVNSDPYLYYELLKGGDKIRVTIPLIVSKLIPEGLNNVALNYSYAGGKDGATFTVPVKDIQNEIGSISKPKLIVSKYSTDVEELRAGSTFNFTFDLLNTNASVTAKNITVTISQPDNIFTVTQGSNSFFIDKIEPGETISNTLSMKVKSDASTKAYSVEILIEYEYDGAEPNPTTGETGVSRTEKLNLQAVENSRPVVDSVNVYSYNGMVTVGQPATLSLAFYNMGRSPLNNVTINVEGDFTGNMYFIGNAAEGTSTYAEFEVTPNIEGTANGLLRVTFEDSNGDTVEFTKEFSQQIMGAGAVIGPMDGGSGEVFNPNVITAKKAIMPIWLFVIINCAIFILFIPITRKIIISTYKAKLRRKEQEQYYNSTGV